MNREQIIQMAEEAAHPDVQGLFLEFIVELERFAAMVAAHEREECAKVCDDTWDGDADTYAQSEAYNECAAAIRERKA